MFWVLQRTQTTVILPPPPTPASRPIRGTLTVHAPAACLSAACLSAACFLPACLFAVCILLLVCLSASCLSVSCCLLPRLLSCPCRLSVRAPGVCWACVPLMCS